MTEKAVCYFDYKSPYSYLAKDLIYEIEAKHNVEIEWLPFVLDLPAAYGNLDERNELQWDKVKYLYLDARRIATPRGLIVKGPKKIFDSRLASIGTFYAREHNQFKSYHDMVFEKFFLRELDIENQDALIDVFSKIGIDGSGFEEFIQTSGETLLARAYKRAREQHVFGVPTVVYKDEPFWGTDRLDLFTQKIQSH